MNVKKTILYSIIKNFLLIIFLVYTYIIVIKLKPIYIELDNQLGGRIFLTSLWWQLIPIITIIFVVFDCIIVNINRIFIKENKKEIKLLSSDVRFWFYFFVWFVYFIIIHCYLVTPMNYYYSNEYRKTQVQTPAND